jgi:hypothetical protein
MDPQLERLKADLESIRAVAGLGEPLTGVDLRVNLLTAAAGGVALLWSLLARPYWHIWGLLAVLVPFAYLVTLRWKHRRSTGASPAKRREYDQDLKVLWLAIPYLGYSLWGRYLGMKPMHVLGTVVFFVAVQMLAGSLADPRHRYVICWALVLAVGALLLPIVSLSPVAILGLVIALGGAGSSFIIYLSLRAPVRHGSH